MRTKTLDSTGADIQAFRTCLWKSYAADSAALLRLPYFQAHLAVASGRQADIAGEQPGEISRIMEAAVF